MIAPDRATATILERFRFDPAVFEKVRVALASGSNGLGFERLSGNVASPGIEDLVVLPQSDSPEGQELAAIGRAALARGEVGVVVLAGGMATRFGGGVKAVVDVLPGYSFLRLKLEEIRLAAAGAKESIPAFLLTSFCTSDEIQSAVRDAEYPQLPVQILEQSVTMRLTKSGDMYLDALGRPSLCATGHGDLLPTLRSSGALASFRKSGGRMLMVSNVDNLASTLDPRVIGAHCRGGKSLTVEIVRKEPGDSGGIPARVDGQLQIVEEFRLPVGFDSSHVPFFNTNTFLLDAAAIDREFDLDWFPVHRKIDGQETIQVERLLGQITAFLPTQFLVVERHGRDGRFLPVKDRNDLDARKDEIQALLHGLGVL
jgi:UTP--glucose-1-phosphate uridylyltransferase